MLVLQMLATTCGFLNVSSEGETQMIRITPLTLRPTEPSCLAVFYIFETGFHVVQAGLELAMRLALMDRVGKSVPLSASQTPPQVGSPLHMVVTPLVF